MSKQYQKKNTPALRRGWKAAFALLFAVAMVFSFVPELSASALAAIGDGISAILADGTIYADASCIVIIGAAGKNSDVTLENGRKVVIRRGKRVILYATARENETISALLRREGISITPPEKIFVNLSDRDADLEIASELTYYEALTETVPYTTVSQADYTLPKGTTAVTQQGAVGSRSATYEVVYADGKMLSRQRIAGSEQPSRNEIIRVGTLVSEAQPGDSIASVVQQKDGSGYLLLKSGDSLRFSGSMAVTCTAYSSEQRTVGTVTATGTRTRVGVVAVDRKVIPLGTTMFIASNDGAYTYGMGHAEDTGVRGQSVDLYMDTIAQCMQFGRRSSTVYFLEG